MDKPSRGRWNRPMIATTIKGDKLDEIEAGTKTVEYRACNTFWRRKLHNKLHGAIIFLCGPKIRLYKVIKIELIFTPVSVAAIITTVQAYAIHLGGRRTYRKPQQRSLLNGMD